MRNIKIRTMGSAMFMLYSNKLSLPEYVRWCVFQVQRKSFCFGNVSRLLRTFNGDRFCRIPKRLYAHAAFGGGQPTLFRRVRPSTISV